MVETYAENISLGWPRWTFDIIESFHTFFQSLQMIHNIIPNDPTKLSSRTEPLHYTLLSFFLSFENQTIVARTHAVNTRMEKKNNGEIDLEETWRTAADRATSSSFKLESDVTRRGKGRITRCGRNAFPWSLAPSNCGPTGVCTTERSAVGGGRGNQGEERKKKERTERERRSVKPGRDRVSG